HVVVALIPGVTEGQNCTESELPLNRQHVTFGVRHAIVVKEIRSGIDGNVIPKVDVVRLFGGGVQRRFREWESLPVIRTVRGRDERLIMHWRRRTQIVGPVGWDGVHYA